MILCLGTTPAAQRVMIFPQLLLDAVNRAVTTLDGAAGKSINVAKVLKTLGEDPIVISFLGGDRGDEVRGVDLWPTRRRRWWRLDAISHSHRHLLDRQGPPRTRLPAPGFPWARAWLAPRHGYE